MTNNTDKLIDDVNEPKLIRVMSTTIMELLVRLEDIGIVTSFGLAKIDSIKSTEILLAMVAGIYKGVTRKSPVAYLKSIGQK